MVEIRIHGRGGQGVVTAADMLAYAAFAEGRHAQSFPSFGSERTGAPVVSFCRIRDDVIRTREPVLNPDLLIVQDPTVIAVVDVFAGLTDEAYVIVNTEKNVEDAGLSEIARKLPEGHVITVPATDIAREHTGKPIPNAVLLGASAALAHLYKLESVSDAIRKRFPGKVGEMNVEAAQVAYDYVIELKKGESANA
ncbi:MAG: 2-oxoacid:acceptor oxidoreductase family protein [Actinomycetaceae bacterium]|nr:2-oxoacid:acceptor oxidoreductase family protein [Actinomycetaceae bacterium]MDY6083146.1 2-oxoacid:acceptor oxidoreductase family protein [Actinomycetaceae bacterium]